MGERSVTRRRTYDQSCPVAHALDLVGERWTMLIVRDLIFGPLRFTDLREGLPGIAPNLLAERLRWLDDRGIVEKVELPAPAARTVYALTPRGRDLGPVVHALARFGVDDWNDTDDRPPPRRLLRGALLSLMTPEVLDPSSWAAVIRLPGTSVGIVAAPAADDLAPLARLRLVEPASGEPTPGAVVVDTTLGVLVDLRRRRTTRAAAEADGRLGVQGPRRAATQVARLFGWR